MKLTIGQKVQLFNVENSLAEIVAISGNKVDIKFINDIVYGNSIREYNKNEIVEAQLYKVARYFDYVFEKYMTEPVIKKVANEECDKLNKKERHYVSYEVVKHRD